MKSLVGYRRSCLPLTCGGKTRLRSGLVRLRPIVSLGSVPLSSTPGERGQEAKEAPESPKHQDQHQLSEVPTTVDVESMPVVPVVAQPTAGEPSASHEPKAVPEEPATSQAGTAFVSHPVEDIPEEVEDDIIASKELVSEVLDGSAFGKRGEQWLFAQVAVVAMLVFPPLTLKGVVGFGATLCLTTGLVFIATAFFNLGRNISPLPEPRKRHRLVVSGIYGYARHPMYAGLILAAFGFALLTRNETRLALVALLWWVLENKVAEEERALSERYPEYVEYKAKVKKFLPFMY